ncbi:hypothetical protein [Tenacibaculum sp. SDUM215027]|uniref:hypothetical protein n=1 Tax=Tenacibaculum sp. SDUM215027 TaxID=3422596 RepID=UPI003D31346D
MNFKKKILFLFSYLITVAVLKAQENDFAQYNDGSYTLSTFSKTSKSIKGSPFIQDQHTPLKISSFKNDLLVGKYNAHQDYFEIKLNNEIKSFIPDKYSLGKDVFLKSNKVYRAFYYDDNNIGFFVITFNSKKATLLTKEQISFKKAQKPTTGYDKYKPAAFHKEKDVFYIHFKNSNNLAIKLPTNKKKFINLFGKNSQNIKKFIKSKKINIRKKENIKKVLIFYSNL